MKSKLRVQCIIASILGCLLLCPLASLRAGEQPLGRVLYSQGASLRGAPIPASETVLNGDVLTTTAEGSGMVELKPGTRVKVAENSSVRFLHDGQMVRAELLSGSVVAENTGTPTLVVSTPRYQFTPEQGMECRYEVRLSPEQTTVAAAMEGNVVVRTAKAGQTYVLPEGKYAVISASAVGVPGQQAASGTPPSNDEAGTVQAEIPNGEVQRGGHGGESPLNVNDEINWGDIIHTLHNGRLQLALANGSLLNVGPESTVSLVEQAPQSHQGKIELTSGEIRVREATTPNDIVETPIAITGALGNDSIVDAQSEATIVYCLKGTVPVRNVNPAIAGEVVLHAGQFTSVARGLPPAQPENSPEAVTDRLLSQTSVQPGANMSARRKKAVPPGWHIGSLSEAASVGLLLGVGGGAAAAVAVPVIESSPASPSSPQ